MNSEESVFTHFNFYFITFPRQVFVNIFADIMSFIFNSAVVSPVRNSMTMGTFSSSSYQYVTFSTYRYSVTPVVGSTYLTRSVRFDDLFIFILFRPQNVSSFSSSSQCTDLIKNRMHKREIESN